jgi:hypothetical protein
MLRTIGPHRARIPLLKGHFVRTATVKLNVTNITYVRAASRLSMA